ncbi:MAG: YlxR family protein [Bacilli bacterium]|nr:YlxR family protein [Bacilli bacterium]
MKKMPERTCIVTKEKTLKKDLLRVVRDKDGNVSVDTTGKANGRGAYLKRDAEVINKAKETKILDKALEVNIPDSVYEEMLNIIK